MTIYLFYYFFCLVAGTTLEESSEYEILDEERETTINQDMSQPSGAAYSDLVK